MDKPDGNSVQKSAEELLVLEEVQLSEEQRDAFKAAFLQKDKTVQWQGERYRIVTMDQAYPEDGSDHIPVSFHLKKVTA